MPCGRLGARYAFTESLLMSFTPKKSLRNEASKRLLAVLVRPDQTIGPMHLLWFETGAKVWNGTSVESVI